MEKDEPRYELDKMFISITHEMSPSRPIMPKIKPAPPTKMQAPDGFPLQEFESFCPQ